MARRGQKEDRRVPAHARGAREARPPKLARQLDSFTCRKRPRGWCSGTRRAGNLATGRAVHAKGLPGQWLSGIRAADSRRALWEKSGHWENYKENMFTTESENRDYAIKPMNCQDMCRCSIPVCVRTATCHCATANSAHASQRSERCAARNHARTRLHAGRRHIFCTEDQILDECVNYTSLLQEGIRRFRFYRHNLQASTRP